MAHSGIDFGDALIKTTLHLCMGGSVSTAWIRGRFGVSKATAKRYLIRIEASLPVVSEKGYRGAIVLSMGGDK
jgi:DNA-binding GntR family transcriptional regulator